MPINTSARPRLIMVPGVPRIPIWDLRHRYPVTVTQTRSGASMWRPLSAVKTIVAHHDGVIMGAGDKNYNGTSEDEDIARCDAAYNAAERFGWPDHPYHLMCSPNARAFWTRDTRLWAAHVGGHNHDTIGVATMGDYTSQEATIITYVTTGGAIAVVRRGLWRKPPNVRHRDMPGQSTACNGGLHMGLIDGIAAWADGF